MKYYTKQLVVRLTPSQAQWLRVEAEATFQTESDLIRRMIDNAILAGESGMDITPPPED